MAELSAATEIASPLVRRRRAGKAAIVLVTYPGDAVPPHLVRSVDTAFREADLQTSQVELSELAPHPVTRLAALRDRSGIDIFSIDCNAEQLKYGTLISSLNIHRNTFAREKLCAVFWMPARGMQSFARSASNFLDFRTRLIEIDAQGRVQRSQPDLDREPTPAERPEPSRLRGRYAAFISYSHRYAPWVKVLQRNLERCLAYAGDERPVFLDQVDLEPSRSWVGQLQVGIHEAEKLILVVTPEALASPRVADEWTSFVAMHRDWDQGHLQIVHLVDTPIPPFLTKLQLVDFREHDEDAYRTALRELVGKLLGHADKRSLPELAEGVEVPDRPHLALPAELRGRLVAWMEPAFRLKISRRALAVELGLKPNVLDGHLSRTSAASAAVVLATGDDHPVSAALRIADTVAELLAEDQPERVRELEPLRAAIERVKPGSPQRNLLQKWLERVVRDHATLVSYFQERAGFDLLDPVYVQIELRPEPRELVLRRGEGSRFEQATLREILELDPTELPWVTRRWVVRGDPGAGKTTMLRHLAAKLASDPEPSWIPVFESLPRLVRQGGFLLDRLEKQMRRAGSEAKGLAAVLDRAGHEGRLLLLLVGLHEVPAEDRYDAEVLLRDFSARWPKTPIVVTSRPIGYRRPGSEYRELDLLPLDASRRRKFLARWFGRFTGEPDEERAERAAAGLEEDPGLRELSANPLYLTLMALLIEQGNPPDRHRTDLYDQVFHLLLNGKHQPAGEPIQAQGAVRAVLRYLADAMTRDDCDTEPVTALEARLYQPAADRLREPLERVPRWRRSMRPFLSDLAECTGILGPHDGPDTDWRFWHRTFREALTAEHLEQVFESGGQAAILEHTRAIAGDESRWAEPYALLAGRVKEPDKLVRALVYENRALGLRAVATAQGLRDETLAEVLKLSDKWEERAKVYERIPGLIDDPDRAMALLDRLRRRTRDGNDLYFLDRAIADAASRWEGVRPRAEQLRSRLYDHIPPPPEALFRWIETPKDGRVKLWRETPTGSFQMGSPQDEEGRWDDEGPRHEVSFASPFALAAVPVTNSQYAAFDPSLADDRQPNQPVVGVTWYAAMSFCRWLATADEWARGARLPTEAEWEYACRAGTTTRFWSGDAEGDLARVGWYDANSGWQPHEVGEKPANPWGLYDVHGNVQEWTSSPWSGGYSGHAEGRVVDPSASLDDGSATPIGVGRVIRGGSYRESAARSRAAYRREQGPSFESHDLGFRVMLPSPQGDIG